MKKFGCKFYLHNEVVAGQRQEMKSGCAALQYVHSDYQGLIVRLHLKIVIFYCTGYRVFDHFIKIGVRAYNTSYIQNQKLMFGN